MDIVNFLAWVVVQIVLFLASVFAGAALFLCDVSSFIENQTWVRNSSRR